MRFGNVGPRIDAKKLSHVVNAGAALPRNGRSCGGNSRSPEIVRAQPAVARAVRPLDPRALVGVVGVEVGAALEVGRQRERLVCNAVQST